jgi:hypothetical protein
MPPDYRASSHPLEFIPYRPPKAVWYGVGLFPSSTRDKRVKQNFYNRKIFSFDFAQDKFLMAAAKNLGFYSSLFKEGSPR